MIDESHLPYEQQSLLYRLKTRAHIRRQISSRKSVQEGKPDRLADLLDEAAKEIEATTPTSFQFYMLVGLPGTGKSTWIDDHKYLFSDKYAILSTDNYIERIAELQGTTYDRAFAHNIKDATDQMEEDAVSAFSNKTPIVIWDQTNLSVKSRAQKLRMVPLCYRKIAVVLAAPSEEELQMRLSSRVGKTIPDHVVKRMMGSFEFPASREGFDEVHARIN
jgi:predicted kinase